MLIIGALAGCKLTSSFARQNKWADIPYATVSPAEKLDIYLPTIEIPGARGPYPVIISVHGGAFCGGDKVGPDVLVAWAGLKRGYAVVSVNYRLTGEAVFPAQINDIKAAIRFVRANAREYDLDPNKIAIFGSSAGGGLAALAGTSGDVRELQDLTLGNPDQSDRVQAVVDWCGPINLLTIDEQFKQSGIAGRVQDVPDSFGSEYLGKQITQVPDLAKKANPETYISADDPPFFVQHGSEDNLVPVQQSTEFVAKLNSILGQGQVHLELLQGAGHGGTLFTSPDSVNKILDFLDKSLK